MHLMPLDPSPSRYIASRMGSMAASVFPIPVGATSRRWPPLAILGMTSACGGVGSVMPLRARDSTSAGERPGKGM